MFNNMECIYFEVRLNYQNNVILSEIQFSMIPPPPTNHNGSS